jgi:NTE family protein
MKTKDVALVLSSGGPRGWAYIGAIEELESRGYNITSIAGTSIGSLIGGIYAAGRLAEIKEWLYSLDAWKVFSLMDISLSKNHLVKGDKVIGALKQIVPEINIEDLNIPYRAVAADLYTGEEVVFDQGPLFEAVRASISIPSLFRPVKYGFRTLVDGGIVDTMPIDRVIRSGNDIVVAFDVNDVDVESIRNTIIAEARIEEERINAEGPR